MPLLYIVLFTKYINLSIENWTTFYIINILNLLSLYGAFAINLFLININPTINILLKSNFFDIKSFSTSIASFTIFWFYSSIKLIFFATSQTFCSSLYLLFYDNREKND